MKPQIFLYVLLGVLFVSISSAQTPTPIPTPAPAATPNSRDAPVLTTQGYLDDSTKAFTELVTLRDTVQKFLAERGRTEVERSTAEAMIKGLNQLIDMYKAGFDQWQKMALSLQQVITFQFEVIKQMRDMLLKPKSFLAKLLDKAMKVLEIAIFVLVGRGLGSIVPQNRLLPMNVLNAARSSSHVPILAYG